MYIKYGLTHTWDKLTLLVTDLVRDGLRSSKDRQSAPLLQVECYLWVRDEAV
jgi:hypothetical protein